MARRYVLRERKVSLAELKPVMHIVSGQKIAFVTNVAWHQNNAAHIVELARDAGEIARAANAGSVTPMHFPPCYQGEDRTALCAEVAAAFGGATTVCI
jgi:ribonuclease BN (tRNA processing enzyme)